MGSIGKARELSMHRWTRCLRFLLRKVFAKPPNCLGLPLGTKVPESTLSLDTENHRPCPCSTCSPAVRLWQERVGDRGWGALRTEDLEGQRLVSEPTGHLRNKTNSQGDFTGNSTGSPVSCAIGDKAVPGRAAGQLEVMPIWSMSHRPQQGLRGLTS